MYTLNIFKLYFRYIYKHINAILQIYPRFFITINVKTSFVVIDDQISCIFVTNDNTYTFNQTMNMYFDNFYFSSKDHVICDYGHM
jgi:hypothetical protein